MQRDLAAVRLERGDIHTAEMAVMAHGWGGKREKLRVTSGFPAGL